jgi:ribosomal silencing factor RsfS
MTEKSLLLKNIIEGIQEKKGKNINTINLKDYQACLSCQEILSYLL